MSNPARTGSGQAMMRPALKKLNLQPLNLPKEQFVTAKANDGIAKEVLDRYAMGNTIGCGSTASVVRAVRLADNRLMAVKCIRTGDEGIIQLAKDEIEILKSVSHPNIVGFFDSFIGGSRVWIWMELCENGDLASYRERHVVDEARAMGLCQQLLASVDFLHHKRIVHRDMKAENCLITHCGRTLKVTDFNSAKVVGSAQNRSAMLTPRGTKAYYAPELTLGKLWNERIDIWASGLVCYFIVFGVLPFDCSKASTKQHFSLGRLPFINWNGCGMGLKGIICQCLTIDMRMRPSAMEMLTGKVSREEARLEAGMSFSLHINHNGTKHNTVFRRVKTD